MRFLQLTILAIMVATAKLAPCQSINRFMAGDRITLEQVEAIGEDNCFVATEIDDEIFQRIEGKSYKEGCKIPLDQLRYIKVLHCDKEQDIYVGELICNIAIAQDIIDILRTLYQAKYPIERMILVDEYGADDNRSMSHNNSSSFNYRVISGTDKLSNHSWGMAIDINPLYNPYVRGSLIEPRESEPYVDRTKSHPYMIKRDDLCCSEFLKHGFEWGGDWTRSKDYQHFEKPQTPKN